ncbi:family 31 glycoside hydrolase [Lipomyces orientalis]|uniref:Family 31 glycoside hydrolase n=1 Tax=Lipomyces orientalis TaxID=1233043 RepID=A0ACC3TKY4_9ASCO
MNVYSQYGLLTGFTSLPPIYALGYHQSRWNYNSEEDVLDVDANFDNYDIPYDAIWLDIETLTTRRYKVYEGISKNELAVRRESAWIDTFNPKAVEYWKDQLKYGKYCGHENNLLIWNDMNEPSVFNWPEVSAPRDSIHYGNWEHRDVHNVYFMTFVNATVQALQAREPRQRPFVLTRSFFAGSQRLGAMWTGDNAATWDYLRMLLSHSVAGFSFVGADVGGYFGNPTSELLTRWYQAGPWLRGEPYASLIRAAIRLRYQLLPSVYTAFHRASFDGVPIVRPMFLLAPDNEDAFGIDDQFFFGETRPAC